MNATITTASPAVETHAAVAAANRAIWATGPQPKDTLLNALSVMRAADTMANCLSIDEQRSEALYDQRDLIWSMIAKAPITCSWDAAAKLELVAETFEMGERMDGLDAITLRQVIRWLRHGGVN